MERRSADCLLLVKYWYFFIILRIVLPLTSIERASLTSWFTRRYLFGL